MSPPRQPLTVVVVHNRYRSAQPSGENKVVESDIERLRADGVVVHTYFRDSDEVDEWTTVKKTSLAVRPIASPSDALAFRRLLGETRPDLVHLHNPFPLISPWIIRTAKGAGVPVVQTVHNHRHACVKGICFRDGAACTECVGRKVPWPAVKHGCYQDSRVATLPMAISAVLHRSTWRLVDLFLPVGDGVAGQLRALGIAPDRIVVRPNTVEDPGRPVPLGVGVLFVGRLSAEKGISTLLAAWRSSGLGARTTLTIAGDGELRPMVEAAASEDPSIRYLGFLDRTALDEQYRACAVTAAASLCPEADGIAVVGALAHGRPYVSTNLGAIGAYSGTESGWLCEPDAAALGAALQAALSDRAEAVRRGRNARRLYEDTRDPAKAIRLLEVYERVIRRREGDRGSHSSN